MNKGAVDRQRRGFFMKKADCRFSFLISPEGEYFKGNGIAGQVIQDAWIPVFGCDLVVDPGSRFLFSQYALFFAPLYLQVIIVDPASSR